MPSISQIYAAYIAYIIFFRAVSDIYMSFSSPNNKDINLVSDALKRKAENPQMICLEMVWND